MPSLSNTASSYSAWASPWMTPPCTCPSTISGLTCTPQSSTATYCSTSTWPVSVSTSTVQMCVPNGHEKFGRVVRDLALEVRLETVGQVVCRECLERNRGQRHAAVGRSLHAEHASDVLEVGLVGLELVGSDLGRLVDHLVARHRDGDTADRQRSRPVGVEAERGDRGVAVQHVDVVGADTHLLGDDHAPRRLVALPVWRGAGDDLDLVGRQHPHRCCLPAARRHSSAKRGRAMAPAHTSRSRC